MSRKNLETGFLVFAVLGMLFIILASNLERTEISTDDSFAAPDDGSTLAEGAMSGYAVRGFDDYEKYKSKMSEEAYDALTSSLFYEKRQYIITAADYEKVKDKTAKILSAEDIQDLPIINAVAINAKRSELLSIMVSEGISIDQVYLDMEAELLRATTLETLNITNIRIYGPVAYNMTGHGVRIGLIDSGLDTTHSEFNCTPGDEDCFIKRNIDVTSSDVEEIERTKTLDSFSDGTESKMIDLTTSERSARIRLPKSSTILNASISTNSTAASLTIGETVAGSGTNIDMASALESESCTAIDNFLCEYTLTFSGQGGLLIDELDVDYSYTSIIPNADGIDEMGHGTSIAGILHMAAPDAEIYSYKATTSKWGTTKLLISDIINAIQYAMDDDVDIMSMSIGVSTHGAPCINPPLYQAIQKAYERGILTVAAAGNDFGDTVNIPACFDNTIAISSINFDKTISSFSSYGPEVDFTMPGAGISTTGINNIYVTQSGTSFSAPFATAELAMLKEAADGLGLNLKPWQYMEIGRLYAEDIGDSGKDSKTGYGMLRISKMMHSLYNETNILSSTEQVDFANNTLTASIEVWSNVGDTLKIQAISSGFDVNGTIVNVKSIGLGINDTSDLDEKTTFMIYLDSSQALLDALKDGSYSTDLVLTEQANDAELSLYSNCTDFCMVNNTDYTTACNWDFDECMGTCYGDFYCQEDCRDIFSACTGNATLVLDGCRDDCYDDIFADRDFASLAIPLTLEIGDGSSEDENSTLSLGLFSADDIFYTSFEEMYLNYYANRYDGTNISSDQVYYNNFSEPTKDAISFLTYDSEMNYFSRYRNYTTARQNNNKFNLNQQFLPLLKVKSTSGDSDERSFYMTILTPDHTQTTLFSINYSLDANKATQNSTYYTFTFDGRSPNTSNTLGLASADTLNIASGEAKLQKLTSNLHLFYKTGVYEYKIYEITNNSDRLSDVLVMQGSVQALSNLSFVLRNGYIFLGEISQVDFDIINNRGRYISRDLGTARYDPAYMYDNPTYYMTKSNASAKIGQTTYIFNLSGDNAMLDLDGNISNETSASVLFSYSYDNNTALKTESLSLVYPVNMTIASTYPTLAINRNITINITATKRGSYTGTVNVSLEFNNTNCSDKVNINTSGLSFQVQAGSSSVTHPVLISLKNASSAIASSCELGITSVVSGLCLACASHDDYPYTETSEIPFTITDYTSTVSLNPYINETKTVDGESVMVYLNITNTGITRYTGTLYTNLSNNALTEQSLALDLAAGESTLKGFSYITRGKGTKVFSARSVGGSIIEETSLSFSVTSDALSISSIDKGDPYHVNDTATIIVTVANNNDEPEFVEGRITTSGNLQAITSYATATIGASSTAKYTFAAKITDPSSNLVSGTAMSSYFTAYFNTSLTVLSGTAIRVNITDRAKRHKLGSEDTLLFSIDDACEDTFDDCEDVCDDKEKTCKDTCKSSYDSHRTEYDACKEKCNGFSDSDDAKDCRADCKDDYDEFKIDYEDCKTECTDDLGDCKEECADDQSDCLDDRVEIDLAVDEINENDLTLTYDNDDIFLRENDSKKLDFNDDGYYETLMRLYKIVENTTNPCELSCDSDFDTTEAACKSAEESCKSRCGTDSDCKRDCTSEKSDCINDAKDDKESCKDDCDPVITGYELELLSITKEEVPRTNYTIPVRNTTTQNTSSNNQTNSTPPVIIPPTLQTCTQSPEYCKDSLSCVRAGWFWYDNSCNAERKQTEEPPVIIEPPIIEEPPVEEEPDPIDLTTDPEVEENPTIEEPASSGGSKSKMIVIAIIIATILGVIGTGYLFIKNTHEVAGTDESGAEKSAKVKDYFIKQLEKGYSMQQINDALIRLGWQKTLVEEISKGLMLDRQTQDMIKVYRYAKEYGIKDQLMLRRKFSNFPPEVIARTVEEINRRQLGK